MKAAKEKARTWRAAWGLFALQKLQQLPAKQSHLCNLLRRVGNTAPLITLMLTIDVSMATANTLDSTPLEPPGLMQKQIHIIRTDGDLMSLTTNESSPDTVNNSVPLSPPGSQQVDSQAAPEAKGSGKNAHDSAIAVKPVKNETRGFRHLFDWFIWLAWCLFGGFIAGTLSAPRK